MKKFDLNNVYIEKKLKPCPFCGSKAKIHVDQLGQFAAFCTNKYCEAAQGYVDTEGDAIEQWNRRYANSKSIGSDKLHELDNLMGTLFEHRHLDSVAGIEIMKLVKSWGTKGGE